MASSSISYLLVYFCSFVIKPIKKCKGRCPSILIKKYGCNIFSILPAQRESHRRYPRLKMKEERENLHAWECKESAPKVSWDSYITRLVKTCKVSSSYFDKFLPFWLTASISVVFLLPDRCISHVFNYGCTKVKDMQNTVQLCCTETEM